MKDLDKKILEFTAAYYKITIRELASPVRKRRIARPRQCAYLLCHELLKCSYSDVGRTFGGRNHATVLVGIRSVKARNDRREQAFLAAARAHFKKQPEYV